MFNTHFIRYFRSDIMSSKRVMTTCLADGDINVESHTGLHFGSRLLLFLFINASILSVHTLSIYSANELSRPCVESINTFKLTFDAVVKK